MMKRIAVAALALLLAWASHADAQTAVALAPSPIQRFVDSNGLALVGGKLFSYAAGTTTKLATYTDSTGATQQTNPIILNSRGEPQNSSGFSVGIWLQALPYKFVLAPSTDTDPPTNAIWTLDSASGVITLGTTALIPGGTYTTINGALTWGGLGTFNAGLTTNQTSAALSSLNSLYFPTFSQLAGNTALLALSGSVSDSAGSYRDGIYSQVTDSDTTTYTNSHTDFAGRFAAFGPYASGAYQTGDKNIVGMNSYAQGATSAVAQPTFPPGVSGILASASQFGGGIGDNEFYAIQASAANGSIAHANSLAAVQAIVNSNYGDDSGTAGPYTAYGVLASNVGTKKITAAYGFSGAGTQRAFLQAGGATVTEAAIVMPHSATAAEGGTIDYGKWNGNPAGGSVTSWNPSVHTGQYLWVDSGVTLASLDSLYLQLGLTVPVHFGAGQTTPPALTSCGTSPADTGASDMAGTVTMGTGSPTGCIITFNVPYVSAPNCTVVWQGTPLAAQNYTVTKTAITLVQTATSSNLVTYHCDAISGG